MHLGAALRLTEAQVAHMAATGDMSVVSREYEKSIINAWKNFVAGDIVRMVSVATVKWVVGWTLHTFDASCRSNM